ncbi:MAG: hypothetical protein RSA41_07190, partial [Christensenella sp.]
SLNADNMRHIDGGGVRIPNMYLYKKGRVSEAYARGEDVKFTPSELETVVEGMTSEEKEFANIAYEFFNKVSKDAINETSLELVGYEIATVDDYMPIVVDKQFVAGDFESLLYDGTIEGMGMLRERTTSSKPIVLEDITSVILRQIDNVAKYYGLAIPIRNFNKVYNGKTENKNDSMSKAISNTFGKSAIDYIEKLMSDLQGGRKSTDTMLDKLRGRFAQAVLGFNAGSALKQTASLPTAAATLGWKAVLGSMFGKVDENIINKYTPLLWSRKQGASTVEIGDVAANRKWADKIPFLMKWNQGMDIFTSKRLWRSAEIYVNENYKDLKRGSDEYYTEVAKWWNKTIEDTQSNYSLMQRPQVLRSENQGIKGLTMFMTDRLQTFNVLYEAAARFSTAKNDFKANPTEENEAAVKQYGEAMARSVSAVVTSNMWIAAVAIAVKYLLGRTYQYEDEEGSVNIIQAFFKEFFSAASGIVLGGSELYAVISAALFGDKLYNIESPNVQMINALFQSIVDTQQAIANGSDKSKVLVNLRNVARAVSKFFGIPIENIEKYVIGIGGRIVPEMQTWYENIFYPNDLSDLKNAGAREFDSVFDTVVNNRMSEVMNTPAADEIKRLYGVADEDSERNSMFLGKIPKKIKINGKEIELTDDERKKMQEKQNAAFADTSNQIIELKDYADMTDDEKLKAISIAANMAETSAKNEMLKNRAITVEHARTENLNVRYYAIYAGTVKEYSNDGKTNADKKQALYKLNIPEKDKAEIYSAVFEDKDTSEAKSIANAVKNGVAASTFVNFKAQPFWSDDAIDKTNGSKTVQGKEWILKNAAQGEMEALYKIAFEDKDTNERDTIKYAQEQGVTPTAFLAREVQKSGEHAEAGESKEDLIWENGKIVVDEKGSSVSGSKMRTACKNLSEGEYSDTEKAYFYQREYPGDNNFALAMEAGVPADTYIGIKAQDFKGVKADSGKTVSGSVKREYIDYINGLDVSDEQKSLLISFKYKDSKLSGGGGRGRGGRRRSGSKASTKAAAVVATSPTIPASAWNIVSSTMKKGKLPKIDMMDGLRGVLANGDKIRRATMEQQIRDIDANPLYSARMKSSLKADIRERYRKGGETS